MLIESRHTEQWIQEWIDTLAEEKIRCSRCLFDENTPSITFNSDGVCNYCKLHDEMEAEYPSGDQ